MEGILLAQTIGLPAGWLWFLLGLFIGFVSIFIAPLEIWRHAKNLSNKFDSFFKYFEELETGKWKKEAEEQKRLEAIAARVARIEAILLAGDNEE